MQVIFYFLLDFLAHPDYFKNEPLKPALGGEGGWGGGRGAYTAFQITVLRLSQTESPIFLILYVL